MSIPSIVYKAHATGNDFVVYLDEDGMHEPTADEVRRDPRRGVPWAPAISASAATA